MTRKTAQATEAATQTDTSGTTAPRRRGPGRPFQKGQSGNPNGRRRKMRPIADFREMVLAEFERELTMNENGKPIKVTAFEAVLRSTIVSAVKGNSRSQRQAAELYMQVQREHRKAADQLLTAVFLDNMTFEQAQAKAKRLRIRLGSFRSSCSLWFLRLVSPRGSHASLRGRRLAAA
ncbi:DUF5681 domain-containing protein [Methylobacterium nodulans]|uniref:DUF5681 domain-containing protein n=1 Tax=Methylobacterium nodulans (strain LMG 21967 / CNCM I-2342 / ORS 2060) TaxID=460265 RepID=B8IGK3_METNO|nr:DUF5681 domain-containing protein [Methylobacterium nodulans]ACL55903.1 hypothetical protein Mnod_0879 [Methylobacterium nodulans ORS 2060]